MYLGTMACALGFMFAYLYLGIAYSDVLSPEIQTVTSNEILLLLHFRPYFRQKTLAKKSQKYLQIQLLFTRNLTTVVPSSSSSASSSSSSSSSFPLLRHQQYLSTSCQISPLGLYIPLTHNSNAYKYI